MKSLDLAPRWGAQDFRNLASIIEEESGIRLPETKNTLMETRLQKYMNELDCRTAKEFIQKVTVDREILQKCIEYITTHKTEWFREPLHFDWLKNELTNILARNNQIQIWSAACSTGEEVFSLALELASAQLASHQVKILGTDISTVVLEKAQNLIQQKKVPLEVRERHSQLLQDFSARQRLSDILSNSIKLRQFNLIKSSLPSEMRFDVIFLRNVLIYFDAPTVAEIISRLSQWLSPNGYLVLGLSESLDSKQDLFEYLGRSIYQRKA